MKVYHYLNVLCDVHTTTSLPVNCYIFFQVEDDDDDDDDDLDEDLDDD